LTSPPEGGLLGVSHDDENSQRTDIKPDRLCEHHGAGEVGCTGHTTAGVTINENADPDVTHDMGCALDRAVPWEAGYRHCEGNSAAHVKASLMGSSVQVILEAGRMQLGTWQGIFFCEFDGPRSRKVYVAAN
jgi:secondary thiamine-phosphate synthase enzyme